MTNPIALAVALAATLALPARADTLSSEGTPPWEMCGECHGLDGLSAVARFPRLAGQDRAYIEKQLRDFRAGRRSNDSGQMSGSMSELTEETIPVVAVYFSAQPPNGTATVGGPPACRSCHSAGSGVGAPRLEGQHAGYLAKQLRDFRDARRTNDADGVMRAVAARLSDAEVDALADALSTAPPNTEGVRP